MKVSIITVCKNSLHTISQTIESVKSQSYPNIEHIVCDGESNDGTTELLKEYQDRGYINLGLGPDSGIYDAMNKGIRMASGDVVAILNSQDFYTSRTVIEDVVRLLESEGTEAVYGDLCYVDTDDTDRIVRYWKSGGFNQEAFLDGWMMPHPTLFVKSENFEKYGYYRDEFKISGDYEMMLRFFVKHSLIASYLPRVLVKMRTGGESNSSIKNRLRANREDRKAWRVNKLVPHPFTTIFKPLRKLSQLMWLPMNKSRGGKVLMHETFTKGTAV